MGSNTSGEQMSEAAAVMVPIKALLPWVKNPRKNDAAAVEVARSIQRFGFGAPVLARKENGEIIAGHTRVKAALRLKMTEVPVRYLDLSEGEAHALALADNKLGELAEWDEPALAAILLELRDADVPIGDLGWDEDALAGMLDGNLGDDGPTGENGPGPSLAERFGVPPFSVLDARQGYWQDRKREWLAMGIQSELGRGASETGIPGGARLPAATLGPDGKTERGDGRGRKVAGGGSEHDRRPGEGPHLGPVGGDGSPDVQPLPRGGEGQVRRTTWVAGHRPESVLDDTSRKILRATKRGGSRG